MKLPALIGLLLIPTFLFAQQSVLKIRGEVQTPLSLTLSDFSKLPHTTASIKDHDGKEQAYSGVSLQTILTAAGATVGKLLNKEHVNKCLLIICADGYKVAYSLAELDSTFTNKVAIIADQVGGKPLPENRGPFRFIMPGEKKLARSAYKVEELVVVTLKE